MIEDIHPFLGVKYLNGKPYVVLFDKEDNGMVVLNATDNEDIKYGTYGEFDEGSFEMLPDDMFVRITNYKGKLEEIDGRIVQA